MVRPTATERVLQLRTWEMSCVLLIYLGNEYDVKLTKPKQQK